ncbi:acetyltransferase [Pseudomonas matsuisoli]|uniref:Acetyltransferase n=2 Tax=Pseudomonas matsuisoli TaxID=1515666 RepID=A0A917PX70_9PSED|nr:acetyltransferase [Pseudomonas matsuisoli]
MTQPGKTTIDKAGPADADTIKAIVVAAYTKYVERMGKQPAPMSTDYSALIRSGGLYALRIDGRIVGAIVLAKTPDSISINNLVVDPALQGHGLGRLLMEFAEKMARSENLPALTLFTNEKMHENIVLYKKIGFVEIDRKFDQGFNRVYFRKQL